ncbi:MAG: response regulator, partial [Actinobacteria bacterium]|nr:response regulator [Actinomycetota bacterium]
MEVGTIAVVEDDPSIADLLDMYLRQAGFKVVISTTGESGLANIERHDADLVILDIGLPGALDGLDVLRTLRGQGRIPVMMLTAREDEIDRILGLELGADDYVLKPFSPREVVARVKAILRRAAPPDDIKPEVRSIGEIEVDPGRREVRVAGEV